MQKEATISILGLGIFIGGLSGTLEFMQLLICGVGMGIIIGGIFSALQKIKNLDNQTTE